MREFIMEYMEPPGILWGGNSRSSYYILLFQIFAQLCIALFCASYSIFFLKKGENLGVGSGSGEMKRRKFTFR